MNNVVIWETLYLICSVVTFPFPGENVAHVCEPNSSLVVVGEMFLLDVAEDEVGVVGARHGS